MDAQTAATAVLILPAAVMALLARRRGVQLGVGVRHGALGEFGRGALFSVPALVLVPLVLHLTGVYDVSRGGPDVGAVTGIVVYFSVLFLVEEVLFRGWLQTGLAVFVGSTSALVLTAVLVAAPYTLTPGTGVLPVVGAVVTNLLHGWVRLRTGRIWWGLGQRWVWNAGVVALGFSDSAFRLDHGSFQVQPTGPQWLTGGDFGLEGGLAGIAVLSLFVLAARRFATPSHQVVDLNATLHARRGTLHG